MDISKRLKVCASLFSKNMIVADIGSDHGYLPFYLLENQIIDKAYASDNKKGPFLNLKKTFNNLSHGEIEIALKSGLEDLPEYVNTVSITGMGGDLIIDILTCGKKHLNHIDTLILSPQQNIPGVRKFLNSIGFGIVEELMILDDKYYVIIKAIKKDQKLTDLEYEFGPILLKRKDQTFLDFYQGMIDEYQRLLSLKEISSSRKEELNQKINHIKENVFHG